MRPTDQGRSADGGTAAGAAAAITAEDELSLLTQFSLDQVADSVLWTDAVGRLIYVSASTCRTLGYSREELLDMSLFDLDPNMSREQWATNWKVMQDRGSFPVETAHRRKDGSLIPVEVSVNFLTFEGRQYHCAIVRDITGRKQTEAALRESEERYRVLVETTSDLIFSFDRDMRLTGINCAAARSLGLTVEAALGKRMVELGLPADTCGRWQARCLEVLASGQASERMMGQMAFPGGAIRAIETDLWPIRADDGVVVGVRGVARDITERKQAEEALRLTQLSVDRAADLIYWVGPDGRLLYASDSTCRRYGYRREEILELSVFDLDPEQSRDTWPERWRQLKTEGSFTIERLHRTSRGEIFPIELTANHVECGGQEYNFAFGRDITERKLAEEALAVEREHLSLLNQAAVEMAQCLTVAEVQQAGIRLACRTTNCDGGVFWVLPNAVRTPMVGSQGLTRGGRLQLMRAVRSSSALSRIVDEHASVVLDESKLLDGLALAEGIFTEALVVPVMSRGKVLGLLCLALLPGHPGLTTADRGLAEGIAALIGVALENARLYDQARYLAQRDPVTGLLNHRGVNLQLEKELARAERSGGSFAVVMMDLDNFKLFNDAYGHACGDEVLQDVSAALTRSVRRGDTVGRYGGDEFVALLPGADAGRAVRTIERIRETVGELSYTLDDGSPDIGTPIPVSMSYGVATYPLEGGRVSELLAAADTNLYRSKRQGGDCVTAARDQRERSDMKPGQFTVLDGLVTAVDTKDRYTRKHSDDVSELAVAVASELGLSLETQRTLRIAALLHDVGKIGIPDHILRKPSRLTEEELEAIRQHVNIGELITKEVPNLVGILDAVSSHHERYDGQGYPRGLKGKKIPLLGRILAATDAYSAMTTDRPYRKALTLEEAREELNRVSRSQLDPRVVRALLAVLDRLDQSETVSGISGTSAA